MNKSENKGLFATAILLLGLFFLGYYFDKKEENSITEININEWLVEKGWALAYRKYSKAYVDEEVFAMNNKAGLWQGKFLEPWVWRKIN